jgi:hypothetical protein
MYRSWPTQAITSRFTSRTFPIGIRRFVTEDRGELSRNQIAFDEEEGGRNVADVKEGEEKVNEAEMKADIEDIFDNIRTILLRDSGKWQETLDELTQTLNKGILNKRKRRERFRELIERARAHRKQNSQTQSKPSNKKYIELPEEQQKERDLVYNSDLLVPLKFSQRALVKRASEGFPDIDKVLKRELEKAATVFGHNPSWSLSDRRKMIKELARYFEKAVERGPEAYSIFRPYKSRIV